MTGDNIMLIENTYLNKYSMSKYVPTERRTDGVFTIIYS